jgi:hypothetical protein
MSNHTRDGRGCPEMTHGASVLALVRTARDMAFKIPRCRRRKGPTGRSNSATWTSPPTRNVPHHQPPRTPMVAGGEPDDVTGCYRMLPGFGGRDCTTLCSARSYGTGLCAGHTVTSFSHQCPISALASPSPRSASRGPRRTARSQPCGTRPPQRYSALLGPAWLTLPTRRREVGRVVWSRG